MLFFDAENGIFGSIASGNVNLLGAAIVCLPFRGGENYDTTLDDLRGLVGHVTQIFITSVFHSSFMPASPHMRVPKSLS